MNRLRIASVVTALAAVVTWSCAEMPTHPDALRLDAPMLSLTAADGVRISEIHYDNDGTDAGEAIEVHGPAGTDLTGWSIVLYNGSATQLNTYGTIFLSGTIVDQCEGSGVKFENHAGIQNGSPDGLALVRPDGSVVEFLSYEGTFTAAAGEGPAGGMTSTDIGANQPSDSPVGHSLQRASVSVTDWVAAPHTFGACNGVEGGGDTGGGDDEEDDNVIVDNPAGLFVSELHYDNDGGDVDEGFEIAGPANTDLSGWTVVLYNGNGGVTYGSTINLSGVIPADCPARGGLQFTLPSNGIQNGPDGLALVDPAGGVVELLSYEGTLTAADGPAAGITSTDIGVRQADELAPDQTLQRDAIDGVWYGPAQATWGCEAGEEPIFDDDPSNTDPAFLSEIRADQFGDFDADDSQEYIELGGAPGASLSGVTLVVVGGSGGVVEEVIRLSGHAMNDAGTLLIGAPTFDLAVADTTVDLALSDEGNRTFVLVRGFTGFAGDDLDAGDDGTLDTAPWRVVVDCVSLIEYLGQGPIYCDHRLGTDVAFTPGHVTRDNDGWFSDTFTPSPTNDTPGTLEFDPAIAVAGVLAPWGVGAPGEPGAIQVSASSVRLPEGFNRALFIDVVDDFRNDVDGAFVEFNSSNPAVVTSDQFGNLTAEGVGEAKLTLSVVGAEHITAEVDVDVIPDVPSSVAYQDHLEFGTPRDADPSDDHLIVRGEYALSYNATLGTSNWVSWNLDASHMGTIPRCECYTPEPERPAGAHGVVNFDYTGSGYSRGHIAQSANRDVTLPDNAATFYTSNIMPQTSANNNGPWGAFESYTVGRADEGEEIWLIAGGEFAADAPTLKDEGNVTIPSWTWKVAVFLDRDETLEDVQSVDDLEVIAIRTPNREEADVDGSVVGISGDWRNYQLTVDELEALIGYDVLDGLPETIEPIVESGFDVLLDAYADAVLTMQAEVANALGQQLEQVARQLEASRPGLAVSRLETFIDQLAVFVRNGKMDATTAATLRAEAERVIEVLNG